MAAADLLERLGFGCEISPAYCDVILRRILNLSGEMPVLLGTGQAINEVAAARGVPLEQADNPRAHETPGAFKHHGPAPFYGSRRKVS